MSILNVVNNEIETVENMFRSFLETTVSVLGGDYSSGKSLIIASIFNCKKRDKKAFVIDLENRWIDWIERFFPKRKENMELSLPFETNKENYPDVIQIGKNLKNAYRMMVEGDFDYVAIDGISRLKEIALKEWQIWKENLSRSNSNSNTKVNLNPTVFEKPQVNAIVYAYLEPFINYIRKKRIMYELNKDKVTKPLLILTSYLKGIYQQGKEVYENKLIEQVPRVTPEINRDMDTAYVLIPELIDSQLHYMAFVNKSPFYRKRSKVDFTNCYTVEFMDKLSKLFV